MKTASQELREKTSWYCLKRRFVKSFVQRCSAEEAGKQAAATMFLGLLMN